MTVDAKLKRNGSETIESKADFARRIAVSRQRVGAMCQQGMPVRVDGRLEVLTCLAWLKANVAARHGAPAPDADDDADGIALTEARKIKIIVETEWTRLQIAKERAELVDRQQVRLALAAFSRNSKERWLAFVNRHGQQLAAASGADPVALMAGLDRAVRATLQEVAAMPIPTCLNEPDTESTS